MNIKMRPGKIAVLKSGSTKKNQGAFVVPETIDQMGVVRYASEDAPVKVGDKVYFGDHRQEIRMAGEDLQVMESSNVIAVVEEDQPKE